ncbi:16S rRNA (cytosine(1407)-C(5))-methyltransferase RsmF [Thaumasiovibrio subtropicus]|uniref:16S rRNA (cytosine(1407)-C(5))-methyltransferase RsmF n=1 Tax=Thaumasiovibrio subtropicus TaxID=1891207 RepID=UPI000B34FE21|nr:16S rRNA (cytosine(1407)-C(5))-methyltransferase RsmF [Thaumasiovibrio subtropicus]
MHNNIYIPADYIETLQSTLPEGVALEEVLEACKRPLRKSLRVNTLKTSVDAFLERAAEKDWHLIPIPWCKEGFWFEGDESTTPLGNSAEHLAGWFYIQEASSMLPVNALLANNPNLDAVLDMASAPGSKTTQLASAMQQQGILVANEYAASRLKVLAANVQRCGIANVALTHFDAKIFGEWLPETFDSILLDAPCSGEGAMRKDEAAMKNWSVASTLEIAEIQKGLIESAFFALKPGGTLVYSTCTLNHHENQSVCQHLCDTFGDAVTIESLSDLFDGASQTATPEGYLHVYPHIYDTEGFFVARFKKNHAVDLPKTKSKKGKFPFSRIEVKQADAITSQLSKDLGITLPDQFSLWQRDKEVWMFPDAITPIITQVRYQRIGVKLAESHKKGVRWQHEGIMALASLTDKETIYLNAEDAQAWFMGRDIRPDGLSGTGEVIVSYKSMHIGLGKWVGNRIKNGLPRDQVRDTNLFKD